MVREALLEINQHENKWCCSAENTLKSTDKKSTVHWTKTKLISFGMVSILALTNSYNMDVTSIPSHQRLRNLT